MIDNLPEIAQKVSRRLRSMSEEHVKAFARVQASPVPLDGNPLISVPITTAGIFATAVAASQASILAPVVLCGGLLGSIAGGGIMAQHAPRNISMAFHKVMGFADHHIANALDKKFPVQPSVEPS